MYKYILIIIIVLFFLYKYQTFENFQDRKTIVSNLDSKAGFYSMLFFSLNQYIYCKKTKNNFLLKSDEWLFNSENGWSDYFEPVELNYHINATTKEFVGHGKTLGDYSIKEYQDAIPEFYRYNRKTAHEIKTAYRKFDLTQGGYGSIFIRRGDKLGNESVLIPEKKYISLLLKKNPHCKIIYLQTDDYNCYKKLEEYIKNKKLDIKLHTLCDKNSVGVIVHNFQRKNLNDTSKNAAYLSTIKDGLNSTTAVEDMNGSEKYKHVMDMLIGIDIVLNSGVCITDYQSNVSRFIKLAHHSPKNVYDVANPNKDIDYNKVVCPANYF